MGMTNEEAIKILSKVTLAYEIGKVTITQKEINEALDMAINALEAQERLTEMLYKQITAYEELEKSKHLNDLEYGRKTAYAHCLEVLNDDE